MSPKPWASRRYNRAINDPDLMKTKEAVNWLGVSEYFLRKYIPPVEWHHAYKKYGFGGRAHFWSKKELKQTLANDRSLLEKVSKNQKRQGDKYRSIRCNLCDKICSTVKEIQRHMTKHIPKSKKEEFAKDKYRSTKVNRKWRCNICGKGRFNTITAVTHHITDAHPGEKATPKEAYERERMDGYECKICGRKSLSQRGIRSHIAAIHLNPKEFGLDFRYGMTEGQQVVQELLNQDTN